MSEKKELKKEELVRVDGGAISSENQPIVKSTLNDKNVDSIIIITTAENSESNK